MARFKRIRTTLPARTLAGQKTQPSTHAMYLKMSHLAMERRRRQVEIDNMSARTAVLRARVATIDRELAELAARVAKPLPVVADADPTPALALGLSIKY